jgi:hypothetical protein
MQHVVGIRITRRRTTIRGIRIAVEVTEGAMIVTTIGQEAGATIDQGAGTDVIEIAVGVGTVTTTAAETIIEGTAEDIAATIIEVIIKVVWIRLRCRLLIRLWLR